MSTASAGLPLTSATGEVTLANSGGGVYNLGVGDLIITNPTTQKAYRNTDALSVGVASSTTTVAIEAVEVGSASTSAPNTITALTTTMLGVTCTNATAVVGVDEETDEDLRVRCREKLSALSPDGPKAAFSYFARVATRAG